MKNIHLLIFGISFFVLFSCAEKESEKKIEKKTDYKALQTENYKSNLNIDSAMLIANPIIIDVPIKSTSGQEWEEKALENVAELEFVDTIFKAVYQGRVKAYNYFTDMEMSIEEVKALEKEEEFSRDRISKIQFIENWYFDSKNMKMSKKVFSFMISYEVYNNQGEIRGYKPAFKINLNPETPEELKNL